MKLHAMLASAVALALAFITPAKAGDVNRDLISLITISSTVVNHCGDQYEFIEGGARKAADQVGADFDTYGPATMNALFAIIDVEYDHSKLIPEVTRQVRLNLEELFAESKKGNDYFCKRYGGVMVKVGFMRRK